MTRMPRSALAVIAALVLVSPVIGVQPLRAATEVTSCDQEYRGRAYLSGDLDCSGSVSKHVVFNGRGKLDLRGFTLTGGVVCTNCTIKGPGTITGSPDAGVRAVNKATIVNVTITANGGDGVEAHRINPANASVVVRDSIITDNMFYGIDTDRKATVRNSVISGHGLDGLHLECSGSGRATLRDATFGDNGHDPVCGVFVTCADIATCDNSPRRIGTLTCESSYVLGSGVPGTTFGICSLD
jgi:Right handed beta helix region